jgi:hypothetical protein
MGAAVPIAGAVVGTVSTINQQNAQRRAAEEQRRGLIAQEQASARNLQLSLQEIERQRMYAGAHAQLQEQARLNNLAFQQNESLIDRQEAQLQLAQQQINAQIQATQAQGDAGRQGQNIQNQLAQGNMQRGLEATGEQAGQQIQQQNLQNRQFGESVADAAGYQQYLNQEQAGVNTGLEGLIGQYAQGQIQTGVETVTANQQAAQGMNELRNMALQGDARQQQGNDEVAQMRQTLGSDGISSSDAAQLQAGQEQIAREAIQRRMVMNQGASDIAANLELTRALTGFQRGQVDKGFANGTRDLLNQATMQRNAKQNQLSLNSYGRSIEAQSLNSQQQLQSSMGRQGRELAGMSQQMSAALQQQQLVQGSQMAQAASDYEILKASLDAGLTNQALDILESARLQRYELEGATQNLNQIFSDMAMSQQAFSQVNAGQAEQAAFRAQQNAVQASKPGFLSYASAIGQGALGVREALYQQPTYQPPSQTGFGGFMSGMNFNQANITNPNSFTNANSYSFQQRI